MNTEKTPSIWPGVILGLYAVIVMLIAVFA